MFPSQGSASAGSSATQQDRCHKRARLLREQAAQRILLLDGAMGTMIQNHQLQEEDYRGTRFRNWRRDLKGNNDLLSLTQPHLIEEIHLSYLEAGCDIVETNTFSATSIAQTDYGMENLAKELNVASARLACRACARMESRRQPRFVAGAIGPTNRTTSISPDVSDPGYRAVVFEQMQQAYHVAAQGLLEGGVDILLVETIFDTLNAKAAIFAIEELFAQVGYRLPVLVSGTITDLSGRTLTGQTPEAFWYSIRHAKPFAVGLNCALGAAQLYPYICALASCVDTRICTYPNAGLPDAFGNYAETPEVMAEHLGGWAREGLLNVVGGCCGSTPAHIAAIAQAIAGVAPRAIPTFPARLRLSGLEPFSFPET